MTEQTISVAEAKKHFSEVLGKVAYNKKRILITKRGQPMARIVPVDEADKNLGDVKGWLDEDDPFFNIMDSIILNRKKYAPKVLKEGLIK